MRHKKNQFPQRSVADQARFDQRCIDQFNETIDIFFWETDLTESVKLVNKLYYDSVELRALLVEKEEADLTDFTDGSFRNELFEVQRLLTFLTEVFEKWQEHPANRFMVEPDLPSSPKPPAKLKDFGKEIPGVVRLKGYSEFYTTIVTGSAMEPDYPAGSLIVMKQMPNNIWHTFSGPTVVADGTSTIFGRIINNGLAATGTLELCFENSTCPTKRFTKDEIWALYEISSIHPGIMPQPDLL